MTVHTAHASTRYYTFDSDADYLTQASHFTSWAETLRKHTAERDRLLQCDNPGKSCRGRTRSFNRLLEKARSLSREEQIDLVNLYINKTKYDDELDKVKNPAHKIKLVRRMALPVENEVLLNAQIKLLPFPNSSLNLLK